MQVAAKRDLSVWSEPARLDKKLEGYWGRTPQGEGHTLSLDELSFNTFLLVFVY